MKMRNFRQLALAATLTGLLFACKKSSDNSSSMTTADVSTQSADQAFVSTESDAGFDDVNAVMDNQASVTGASVSRQPVTVTGGPQDTVESPLCDAVVTIDTTDNPRTITITYNGSTCNGLRVRTGSIIIAMAKGVRWIDTNAVATITFSNLKITRILDGRSIVINGTHTYTNLTGGDWASVDENHPGPVTHSITSSNMSILFDNNTTRNWNVARQRSYTYNNGLVVAVSGTHTDGTTTGISEWGTNRFGNAFTASITSPLTISQSCNWQLTSGVETLVNAAGTTSITFGLDANGNSTGCPLTGSYYLELVFTGKGGKTYTGRLPY